MSKQNVVFLLSRQLPYSTIDRAIITYELGSGRIPEPDRSRLLQARTDEDLYAVIRPYLTATRELQESSPDWLLGWESLLNTYRKHRDTFSSPEAFAFAVRQKAMKGLRLRDGLPKADGPALWELDDAAISKLICAGLTSSDRVWTYVAETWQMMRDRGEHPFEHLRESDDNLPQSVESKRPALRVVAGQAYDIEARGAEESRKPLDRASPQPAPLVNQDGPSHSGTPPHAAEVASQDGIALVFAERHCGQVRFCHDTGRWFVWEGSHWRKDDKEAGYQLVRTMCRQLSETDREGSRRSMRKAQFISGVERLARGDQRLSVNSADWDRDLFLLGTPSGTVDLKTGKLRPADPADGITKLAAIAPSDTADCSRWLSFLDETTGGDVELIRLLQQWCGYALTGDTREHALVFVHGHGGNRKSVFLNALTGILKDYATTAAMDTSTASRGEKHTTDLAMLRGARLVTASETEEGRAWAEARIKQMTGGDPITARFMHRDNFTFIPQFKLTIVGNHHPVLKNVDDAARRRFNIVPFTRKPARPDRQLEEKLRAEWPGILRWMIDGCLDWQANGLIRPASVTAATEAYFSDQDMMARWLEEACDADPENLHKWETSRELFASWTDFAKASGEEPGTQKSFGSAMQRRGFIPHRTTTARGFRGIRLKPQHRYDEEE
jgi:putative DNA primase/helicase